jgi:hypothetical protein
MLMNPAKANFYQLNLNYLLLTAYEALLDKKAKYDPTDPAFLSAIIAGYNRLDFTMNQQFMFKTYFIYVLNMMKRYFATKEEAILCEVCKAVIDSNAQRSVPLDLIDKFRVIVCKRVSLGGWGRGGIL